MSDLLARLIAAGTPADLVAEVAMEIARADVVRRQEAEQAARKEEKRAANARRQREFKARNKGEVTQGNADNALPTLVTVTGVTSVALSPSPNENNSNPHPHTHPENNPVREEPLAHVADWVKFLEDGRRKPKAPRSKTPHPLPADWMPVLTEAAQRIVDGWPPGKLEQEAAAFRDHAADKGRTSKDWQAAFRTWINNTTRWKPQNDRSPSTGRQPSASREGDGFTRALDLVDAALAAKRAGDTSWAA